MENFFSEIYAELDPRLKNPNSENQNISIEKFNIDGICDDIKDKVYNLNKQKEKFKINFNNQKKTIQD